MVQTAGEQEVYIGLLFAVVMQMDAHRIAPCLTPGDQAAVVAALDRFLAGPGPFAPPVTLDAVRRVRTVYAEAPSYLLDMMDWYQRGN